MPAGIPGTASISVPFSNASANARENSGERREVFVVIFELKLGSRPPDTDEIGSQKDSNPSLILPWAMMMLSKLLDMSSISWK